MAVATSLLHRSFKGAIGDFIFRNYNGKTVVSMRPVYKNETNTKARLKARNHFRDAANHAGIAMENPKLKSYYKQKARQLKLPNAYTAAITDYLRKAKAGVVTRSTFAAKKSDVITIRISKSVFKVNDIRAQLCNSKGEVLTEHVLTKPDSRHTFEIVFQDDLPDFASMKIFTDEPGNKEYLIQRAEFMMV